MNRQAIIAVALFASYGSVQTDDFCRRWDAGWDEKPILVVLADHWDLTGKRPFRTNKFSVTLIWTSDGYRRMPKNGVSIKYLEWPEPLSDFDVSLAIARDLSKRFGSPLEIRVTIQNE